mgnify:CR=1 FL=1
MNGEWCYFKQYFSKETCERLLNDAKDIPVQDSLGNFGHAELSGKALGFGFNAGIHYDLNKKYREDKYF